MVATTLKGRRRSFRLELEMLEVASVARVRSAGGVVPKEV